MAISDKSYRIIWGEAAARCCICRRELIRDEGSVTSLVGEVAHVVGESDKAARGHSDLTLEERNEPENLLLLCREHHKLVDDDPATYPVERLLRAKADHVSWLRSSLVKLNPWRSNLSQFTYINVPRLSEQAELQGYKVDLAKYRDTATLHSLGWDLNFVMSAFRRVLEHLSFDSVPIDDVRLHEGFVGAVVQFDHRSFRTKNVEIDLAAPVNPSPFTGDLSKDPHIYTQVHDFRVVCNIDRRWITTSTAFTLFRPSSGRGFFSGLGRVTHVDYESRVITITPWVIGLPEGPMERAMNAGMIRKAADSVQLSRLDQMADLDRAAREENRFNSAPEACDLCGREFALEKYMIDGSVQDLGGAWACMCGGCFLARGGKLGIGYGQMYLNDGEGWLQVAGFDENSRHISND